MTTRQLTPAEIRLLQSRDCQAEDWTQVTVGEEFAPGDMFRDVSFSGTVRLGVYAGSFTDAAGFVLPAGLSRCRLRNVTVGDNCRLTDVVVSGADIGEGALLDRVGILSGSDGATFANGLPAHVLSEDGARAVPLWRSLSAPLAHLICHLKKQPAIEVLEKIIHSQIAADRPARSAIGAGARIERCGRLHNVWVGEGARIEGAAVLEDCCLEGGADPALVGEGVAAVECVFLRASRTSGGVRLRRCLVGEGSRLEDGFTGAHSFFFANSVFGLGEADGAMSGPYAVSHHKATLALTCQCSFNTFGSAANSSNHHFKLGPRHGGVLRRGAKCGSNSYLFWPSDIGAFSTVVGHHGGHLDTADFPFSLILDNKGVSTLIPGINLFGAGCYRDERKWRERDQRGTLPEPLDLVNPAILSPYTLQAIDAAIEVLRRSVDMGVDLRRGGAVIPASRFDPALKLYQNAVVFHAGERLMATALAEKHGVPPTLRDLERLLRARPGEEAGTDPSGGRWRDWGGMLLSGRMAEAFLADLESGALAEPTAIRRRLETIHSLYPRHEWWWTAARWRERYGEADRHRLERFLEEWRKAVRFRHDCFLKDASKEYQADAKVGFGVEARASGCFRLVRGEAVDDPLIRQAEAERDRLLSLAEARP